MNYKLSKSIQIIVLGLITAIGLCGTASAAQVQWGHDDWGTLSAPTNFTFGGDASSAWTDTFITTHSFNTASDLSFSSVLVASNWPDTYGISGLQVSLYSGSDPSSGHLVASSHAPATSAGFTVLDPVKLGAGQYYMTVTGQFTGTSGGWYLGSVNVSPVPEAEVWALFLGGLTFIGFVMFRRSKEQFSGSAALA
jgi:hypothetical protein